MLPGFWEALVEQYGYVNWYVFSFHHDMFQITAPPYPFVSTLSFIVSKFACKFQFFNFPFLICFCFHVQHHCCLVIWNAYELHLSSTYLNVYSNKTIEGFSPLFHVVLLIPRATPNPHPPAHKTSDYAQRRTSSVLISLWDPRRDDVSPWSLANTYYHPSPSVDNKILLFH